MIGLFIRFSIDKGKKTGREGGRGEPGLSNNCHCSEVGAGAGRDIRLIVV